MTLPRPRVRIPGTCSYTSWSPETGEVLHSSERILVRDVVRVVFFLPHDHFELAAGVAHVLDSYVGAVKDCPGALSRYTCCYWEPAPLDDRGWELIRATLHPKERRYAEDYTREEAFYPLKDGADPYWGLYGEQDSGFCLEYHARIPWREAPAGRTSVLRATLPTELLDARGAGFVWKLALEWASHLPFASGHAGLALDIAPPRLNRLDVLRPLLSRHPGFDVREAGIRDELDLKVDGVHWMNFIGAPVLDELGGSAALRARLDASAEVQELEGGRVLVTLGPEPEAGDLTRRETLPAYRELARVLAPWLEPFAWRSLAGQGEATEEEWRHWWYRFLDR